jgi:hypothetical protein
MQAGQQRWLGQYYLARAGFSLLWIAAILTVGRQIPVLGAALLVLYPAWDAAANYADAARHGGLRQNRSQAFNVLFSAGTALAVLVALPVSPAAVLGVFSAWAIVAGLLQLAAAVGRWSTAGAQWAMVLSGGQSALAGGFFAVQALQGAPALAPALAGYAGFGAIYFLVSAVLLFVRKGPGSASAAADR